MNDKNKMFCFQCEQTAGCSGCTGNAGVCGKTSSVSALQDELTGALIGLARACLLYTSCHGSAHIQPYIADLTGSSFCEKL